MKSSPTVRSQLLLIDTCVVIEAHRLHVWESLLSQCHIVVPETVVGEAILVARGFDDISLRLEQQIEEGLFQSPSLEASALAIVFQRCPHFPGKIDPG
jgi:predicted nucleic acid-binding protein